MNKIRPILLLAVVLLGLMWPVAPIYGQIPIPPDPPPEGIGMEGRILQPPPATGPTIVIPADGAVFDSLPITVSGLCLDTMLVRLFKNEVFSGAAICDGGSYQLQMDLFPGENRLIARQYDSLDQVSPDSNLRTVTYNLTSPTIPGAPNPVTDQITLTSTFARKGANPGEELIWPLTLSGGRGPYAISIDWGDSDTDLFTLNAPGNFDGKHVYQRPGVFRVIIKATDSEGRTAFLQLVGIGNGAITPGSEFIDSEPTVVKTRVLWQPALISFPLMIMAFYLGMKYKLKRIRYRMKHRLTPIDK